MDRAHYRALVDAVPLGKRLPQGIYLHVSGLPSVGEELRALIARAGAHAGIADAAYNVVKLPLHLPKVSLLYYPDFFEDGFPLLTASWTVDLERGSCSRRSYPSDRNPPILHRKEALLPGDHPAVPKFCALTAAAEELGLLEEPRGIGHRRQWETRLHRVGVQVVGNQLVAAERIEGDGSSSASIGTVLRHRTALTRYGLSTPMQALWRHGFLNTGCSVFDYGCGRGDDVRLLEEQGILATGWDPYFAPDHPKKSAGVVNLGFVLNVIEDLEERRQALLGAWHLAQKVLAVAVLIGGRSAYERYRLFRDGVLTQRGTFQKYYGQGELRQYLEDGLGREPVAISPGTFFVFRDDVEEQRFLAARQVGPRPTVSVATSPRSPSPARERRPSAWDVHLELLDHYWGACVQLGRQADDAEYDRAEELHKKVGRSTAVFRRLLRERGHEFEVIRTARMADLLVYLALNLFERRRSFRSLPDNLQRDVRAFWGSYSAAQDQARGLLFSAGNVDGIHRTCLQAAAEGLGYLDGDHSLQIHASVTHKLPALLRVYLGCAARLYGEIEDADLVKIHIQSGKVTLMMYDDFEGKPIPNLIERVKVNLRRQDIHFFEYGHDAPLQPLFLKSRYLPADSPGRADQEAFDSTLLSLGLFDFRGFGPALDDVHRALTERGIVLDGLHVRKVGKAEDEHEP